MARTSWVVAPMVGGVIARGLPVGCRNGCWPLCCLMTRSFWFWRARRGRAIRPGRMGGCVPCTRWGRGMMRSSRLSWRTSMSVMGVALPSSLRIGCCGTASRRPAAGAWAPPGFLINSDSTCDREQVRGETTDESSARRHGDSVFLDSAFQLTGPTVTVLPVHRRVLGSVPIDTITGGSRQRLGRAAAGSVSRIAAESDLVAVRVAEVALRTPLAWVSHSAGSRPPVRRSGRCGRPTRPARGKWVRPPWPRACQGHCHMGTRCGRTRTAFTLLRGRR
jgi:hypothetical protein